MRRILLLCLLTTFALLPFVVRAEDKKEGLLILIGGGEIPGGVFNLLKANDRQPRVAVISNASENLEEAFAAAKERFKKGGILLVESLDIRSQADNLGLYEVVFLGGGDQTRLMKAIDEGKASEKLLIWWRAGGTLIGNSAGTAALGSTMITGGGRDDRLANGAVETSAGIGAIAAVVDQHLSSRRRHTRLIAATIEAHPHFGIGIDEDTALVILDGKTALVAGTGTVSVVKGHWQAMRMSDPGESLSATNLELHVYRTGDHIELFRR